MAFLDHITIEATPAGNAVRNYLEGQHTCNKEMLTSCFAEDVVFYGQLYKVTGRDNVVTTFMGFLTNMMLSMRIEAVSRAGDGDQFLVLFHAMLKGAEKEMVIADLVSVKDGKICRVDNCFDTGKVPKHICQDAEKVSNM